VLLLSGEAGIGKSRLLAEGNRQARELAWSDETSLEFLHVLARRSAAYPLLLVLTYRSDEIHPGLSHWLAQLDREHLAQEFVLPSLSRSEVEVMLRSIFDLSRPVPASTLDAIYELTEGNPFFIEEILKSLITAGAIVSPHEMAAVAGRRFDFALLQQITQDEEQELLTLMKELIAAQLVVEESEEQFAFRHALTRQAIYTQLLLRERKVLHRTLAETIEQLFAPTLDAHLTELAYHFYEAGIWEKALSYAQRAGVRALALYAPRAAIEQYTRALKATHHLTAEPVASLYRLRGQAYETLGEFEHARSDYERALHAGQEAHDGQIQWQAVMDLGFLWAARAAARGSDIARAQPQSPGQLVGQHRPGERGTGGPSTGA
jgi:predicted ATPase